MACSRIGYLDNQLTAGGFFAITGWLLSARTLSGSMWATIKGG